VNSPGSPRFLLAGARAVPRDLKNGRARQGPLLVGQETFFLGSPARWAAHLSRHGMASFDEGCAPCGYVKRISATINGLMRGNKI